MTGLRYSLARVLLLLTAFSILAHSQSLQNSVPAPNWVMQVEVKADKSSYGVGELVHFTALLKNKGNSAVYIAKEFYAAGGGNSGFIITVTQITGKRSGLGCGGAGDRFLSPIRAHRSKF
jgi:hypothetical protein